MSKFLGIVYALLMLLKNYQVKKEQADAQKQADSISQDPTDWFNSHFDGGVSNNSAESTSGKATNIRIDS